MEEEDGERVVFAEGGVGSEQRAEGGGRVEAFEGEQGGEGHLDQEGVGRDFGGAEDAALATGACVCVFVLGGGYRMNMCSHAGKRPRKRRPRTRQRQADMKKKLGC